MYTFDKNSRPAAGILLYIEIKIGRNDTNLAIPYLCAQVVNLVPNLANFS